MRKTKTSAETNTETNTATGKVMNMEKFKGLMKCGAGMAAIAVTLGFGFFAMYADFKMPGSADISLSLIMQEAENLCRGNVTQEEIGFAKEAAWTIVGALAAGALLSAAGMWIRMKFPNNRLVRWWFS